MEKIQRMSTISHLFLLLSVCLAGWVFAAPVPRQNANQAVRGWLKRNAAPMETAISKDVSQTEALSDTEGRVLYYSVALKPQGFVILSADDQVEPVIAFSATGYFDSSQDSPLKELLGRDMQSRLEKLSQKGPQAARGTSEESNKWQTLLDAGSDPQAKDGGDILPLGFTSVTDVRVSPLLQSKWGQSDEAEGYCYNYYTPYHYVTGCVATAMAQLMRYHSFPTAGIGSHPFTIYVDGYPQTAYTLGGNGSGGAYNWSQMPYDPDYTITTNQREAIGALCYDAGISVGMSYTSDSSGAGVGSASGAFKNTFGYTNSIFSNSFSSSGDAGLWGMMNTNLDAALPVLLGISGPGVGHAVIADGYGYTSGTMYHHLNMGWAGLDDAWYAMPVIDSGTYFNAITDCVYNIYTSGTSEIISGRITNLAGAPLDGVVVTAYLGSTQVKQTTTNNRGIYALKNLSSNTQYRFSAVKSGYVFVDQFVTTGLSLDGNAVSGNKWGINFAATNASPPTAISQTVDVNSLDSKSIVLDALDDHLPNPPASVTFVITSLPTHGTLSQPGVGAISSVPYTLSGSGNTVVYLPCQYYGGQDSFTFKANDGGTAPTGGDSNIATVAVDVDKTITSDYGLDGNSATNTMIDTTYYAARSQALYLAGDIGPARYLTDLAIEFTVVPPIPLNQWTIRLQHTNMTSYGYAPDDFLTTGWTQVYQANLTVTQPGWVNFHFATPFDYNGAQNLLVDFSFNNTTISSETGWYLFYNVGGSYDVDRVITIATNNASHTSPLTWDFWYGGGGWWGGDWMPSIKFTGDVPIDPISGDFDATCDVKFPDLAILSAAWMTQLGQANYNPACDINNPKDNAVNLSDLLVFANHWLQNYQP